MSQLSTSDEDEKDVSRKIGAKISAQWEAIQSVILSQHADAFKWLMASLLAINAGSAVSVLQVEAIPIIYRIVALSFFVIGILFALLIAVLSQRLAQKSLRPIAELVGYWVGVSLDGVRSEQLEKDMEADLKSQTKRAWVIPGIGWVSAFFFVAGALSSGIGLTHCCEPNSNELLVKEAKQ